MSTAQLAAQQRVTALSQKIPPYGQRRGWKPTDEADYGDGGAYPECPVAQYPLELGRKRKVSERLQNILNVHELTASSSSL